MLAQGNATYEVPALKKRPKITLFLAPKIQQSLKLRRWMLICAVKSLCEEEFRPSGRHILKKVLEQAANSQAHIDPEQLREKCTKCKELIVHQNGKQYFVVLKDDVGWEARSLPARLCPADFPSEVWCRMEAYLRTFGEGQVLPGCYYDCAKQLNDLDFLKNFSRGKVYRIVQLAATSKRLLGLREGKLVPFDRSERGQKEQSASSWSRQPWCNNMGAGAELPLASPEESRAGLIRLLASRSESGTYLSDVKRLFSEKFGLELREEVLGCDGGLLKLLTGFRDICIDRRDDGNTVVVRWVGGAVDCRGQPQCSAFESPICEVGAEVPLAAGPDPPPHRQAGAMIPPQMCVLPESGESIDLPVKNTFVDFSSTTRVSARRRVRSTP